MRTLYSALLLLLLNATNLFSQTGLKLEQCLALAKERSPKLRAASNILHAAELSHFELLTTRLPQIKFSVSSLYTPTYGHVGYDRAITDGGLISGRLIVEQSLYDGGIRALTSDRIQIEIEQHGMEYRMTERDVIYLIRLAYIEGLRAQNGMKLQRLSVAQLTGYLELVNRLMRGGNASYTDLSKTQLQLSSAQTALRRVDEEFEAAKYALAELVGISSDTAIYFAESLETLLPVHSDSAMMGNAKEVLKNLELALSEIELKKSLVDIELTHHETRPVVSLIGDAGLITSGDNLKLPQAERLPILGYSVGVNVDIPLFNWGATDLRVQQKQLASDNQRLQSELLLRSLNTEMKKLHLQLKNARERLHAARLDIKAAEENFLLTKSKYAGGVGLAIEVLSAQQLLTDTKLTELQSLADIQNIQARIDQLLTN